MSAAEVDSGGHERDSADLARFGYKQELKRSLGVFSSFAVAFSYISPSTGIFTLFALGLTTLGGVFIWTWPVVALGQFIVALNFAEVSSHYPVAGSVFQWTKYLAGRSYSWFTGWMYLFAGILTVAAVVATLPLALIPALNGLGWHSLNATSLHTQEAVALITLVVITVLNIYGVRLVALINNTGVLFEILGMFVFALVLMAFHNHQGFHVVTNSGGFKVQPSSFLAAMFISLFVIYGFDTASTLAEETRDPRRAAPKAVLFSVVGAFVIGGVFLLGTLVAIPNLHGAITGNGGLGFGPAQIIEANFSSGFATLYLLVVSAAIFVCCLSIMAATIRLCFGMSRDNQLPWSGALRRVAPGLHTPVWTCLVVAVLAAVPFLKYSGVAIIAIAATGMIYLSYFLGNLVIMRARTRGWPAVGHLSGEKSSVGHRLKSSVGRLSGEKSAVGRLSGEKGSVGRLSGEKSAAGRLSGKKSAAGRLSGKKSEVRAPFRLGRWGMLVNVLALLYGGAMLVNFAWPRIVSNPEPNQTGGLLSFGWSFLDKIPILWTVAIGIAVIGAIYYLAAGRRRGFVPVIPPAGEVPPTAGAPAAGTR
ncbi:MAG TPA: APC family permease [Streptosporangiaceae bacterium]